MRALIDVACVVPGGLMQAVQIARLPCASPVVAVDIRLAHSAARSGAALTGYMREVSAPLPVALAFLQLEGSAALTDPTGLGYWSRVAMTSEEAPGSPTAGPLCGVRGGT